MKNPTIIILAIIAIIVIGYLILKPSLNNKKVVYTYTALEKGNIEEGVLSTGTVEAINTVEVGTQISGTIKKNYVDYNDKVNAGQVLAEMDLKLLNTNLNNTEANMAVSQALSVKKATKLNTIDALLYE